MRNELFYKGIPDSLLFLHGFVPFTRRLLFFKKKYSITNGNTLDDVPKRHFNMPDKGRNLLTNKNLRTNHTSLNYNFKPVCGVISLKKSNGFINTESNESLWTYRYDQFKLTENRILPTLRYAVQNESCKVFWHKMVNQIFNYRIHQAIQISSHLFDKNVITKVKTYNSND